MVQASAGRPRGPRTRVRATRPTSWRRSRWIRTPLGCMSSRAASSFVLAARLSSASSLNSCVREGCASASSRLISESASSIGQVSHSDDVQNHIGSRPRTFFTMNCVNCCPCRLRGGETMAIAVRTAQNTEHRGTHAPTVAATKQRWRSGAPGSRTLLWLLRSHSSWVTVGSRLSAGKVDSWDSAGVDQFDRSANVPRCRAPPAKMGYQDPASGRRRQPGSCCAGARGGSRPSAARLMP
jgi:hypothetical protein